MASAYIDRDLLKVWLFGNRQCSVNCPKIKIANEVSVIRSATLATCPNVEHRVCICIQARGNHFCRGIYLQNVVFVIFN
jgi:hypothetical protein